VQLQQAEGDINQDNAVSDIQHIAVKTFEQVPDSLAKRASHPLTHLLSIG